MPPVSGIVLLQGGGIVGALIMARYIDRGLTIPVLCIALLSWRFARRLAFGLTPATGAAWSVFAGHCRCDIFLAGCSGLLSVGRVCYTRPNCALSVLVRAPPLLEEAPYWGPLIGGWVFSAWSGSIGHLGVACSACGGRGITHRAITPLTSTGCEQSAQRQ